MAATIPLTIPFVIPGTANGVGVPNPGLTLTIPDTELIGTHLSLTVNDTRPALTGTCTSNGSGVNLTGASLSVVIARPDGTKLTKTGAIVSATAGTWSYTWVAGDLSVPGDYAVRVVVTYSDTGVQTFGPVKFYVQGIS